MPDHILVDEILPLLHDAVLAVNEDGTIAYANQEFVSMFQMSIPLEEIMRSTSPVIMQHVGNVYHDRDAQLALIRDMIARGEEVRNEEVNMIGGRCVLRNFIPVRRNGRTVGRIWQHVDVTRLKKVQQQLEAAERAATSANRAKGAFLASMSHELRTPLNAIIGFADVMIGGRGNEPPPEKIREYASYIRESGAHLLKLVNQILDFAKLEARTQRVFPVYQNAHGAIEFAIQTVYHRAQASEVTISVDVAPSMPMIYADPNALRQILVNIIGNSVNVAPRGSVISVSCTLEGKEVCIRVSDQGPGISVEDIERVFQPFYRAELEGQLSAEGLGLGLPIARGLAELHGGELTLSSDLGKGTQVTLRLPHRVADGQ